MPLMHFNPRSPWGERRNKRRWAIAPYWISIHALREESDILLLMITWKLVNFNPRSPWGERLTISSKSKNTCTISIHALREESDILFYILIGVVIDFNPRSPWGERLYMSITLNSGTPDFNPRSPWGERRWWVVYWCKRFIISIHALREESDLKLTTQKSW